MGQNGSMAICETCGNDYWLAFEIRTVGGNVHVFDSFECAIQKLAPICEHCQCKIVGHGVEVGGHFFCCAHCARSADAQQGTKIRDTVGTHPG
jgi:hypothetical protein